MIHNEDLSGHKTWRLIYAGLFLANLILMPDVAGPAATSVLAVVFAFLFWGQQKAIDDIVQRQKD